MDGAESRRSSALNRFTMPKQALEIKDDESALLAVCGSESMAERVKELWERIMEDKKMDVSGQGMNDDEIQRLLKGLHMCVFSGDHEPGPAHFCLVPCFRGATQPGALLPRDVENDRVARHSSLIALLFLLLSIARAPSTGCRRRQASRPSAPSHFPSPSSTFQAIRSRARASAPSCSLRARRERTRRSSTSRRISSTTRPRRRR